MADEDAVTPEAEAPAGETPQVEEPATETPAAATETAPAAATAAAEVPSTNDTAPSASPTRLEERPAAMAGPRRKGARPIAVTTGRRKTSVARVRFYEGTGSFTLNGRSLDDYFPSLSSRLRITEPFRTVGLEGRYDVHAKLEGGGLTGQTDALTLGIARALADINPELRTALKRAGFLTRDPRKVERKKYGLRKARRAPQYTKR
jgi:small subunit ribosomal protein S9